MEPILYIVIPCYNEEEVLPETYSRVNVKMDQMIAQGLCSENSRILFVDDGSKDATWELIRKYSEENVRFEGLKLAHNRGHQNALLAGLLTVKGHCDATISMDADLQDDMGVLDQFMQKYAEGCEVVYGVRKARETDTFFKRESAQAYYRVLEKLGAKIVYNHADYRLMGSRALDGLSQYREVNLFLRGIVPDIGFKTDCVYYDRTERFAGESKYPLKKMIALAVEGITSFSVKPLQMIFGIGVFMSVISLIVVIGGIIAAICGAAGAFYAALFGSLFLIGGLILTALGVMSTYIGKIYSEVKDRPRYLVETWLRNEPKQEGEEPSNV